VSDFFTHPHSSPGFFKVFLLLSGKAVVPGILWSVVSAHSPYPLTEEDEEVRSTKAEERSGENNFGFEPQVF
jgi:hypothetical protein